MVKYYIELKIAPNLLVSVRVYRDDPRKGGAASMEAVKFRNFDTGQLDPAQVRPNVSFRDGYTVEQMDAIITWIQIAKTIAGGLEEYIGDVTGLERVVLRQGSLSPTAELWWEYRDGVFIIEYPATWGNVSQLEH